MTYLCDDVTREALEVIRARGSIAAERPWLSLTPVEHRASLRELAATLLDLAVCMRLARDRHIAYLSAASGLGEELRAAEHSLDELFMELQVLREAIWRRLQTGLAEAVERLAGILRVDVALGVGARAALAGYFRAEHEAAGRWRETIAALELESRRLLAAADG